MSSPSRTIDVVDLQRQARSIGCALITQKMLDSLIADSKRARRRDRTLRLIFGLLSERRWWNSNVDACEQLAKEALLDVR